MSRSVDNQINNMNEHGSPSKQPIGFLKKIRWWIPAGLVVLAAANFLRIRFSTELDSNFKAMQISLSIALLPVLLLLWFIFLSRLRWRTRLIGVVLFALLVFGIARVVRFDGSVDGTGTPRLAWKWKTKKTGNVGPLNIVVSSPVSNPVLTNAEEAGYLGTNRSGVIGNVKLDRDWTAHPPKELWRQPIGLGWSSFCLSNGRAFTQEQRGEDELVICYEMTTGHVIWVHTNHVRFSETMGGDGPS